MRAGDEGGVAHHRDAAENHARRLQVADGLQENLRRLLHYLGDGGGQAGAGVAPHFVDELRTDQRRRDRDAVILAARVGEELRADHAGMIELALRDQPRGVGRLQRGQAALRQRIPSRRVAERDRVMAVVAVMWAWPSRGGRGLRGLLDGRLDRLLEAQIMAAPAERRGDLELVKNLVHSHTRRLARYRCEQCGFKARQFFWHCPGCGGWETYPPKRSEEYDPAP